VNGPDFATMTDAQARAAGLKLKILARSSPHDKLRLVKLLKAAGEVVAVTGDGSNDAPALNYASVGLSMGKSGTASAREASDIVLLDDSFNSIVSAIKWGRSLYDNIQRFIVFQLTINAAALGLMLLGPFAGVKLPLTVPQMLWINLIMDTLAALALASEPPHDSVMSRKPRAKDAFIITRAMAIDILGTGALFLGALLVLIFCFKHDGEFDTHESTVVFTVMVLLQFWNLFNARCFGRTASALKGIFSNIGFTLVGIGIVLGQFLIVQFGGAVFRTQPLTAGEWVTILAATSFILWIGEAKRWIKRRRIGIHASH
jgi:Ca2+-transporting ATPase